MKKPTIDKAKLPPGLLAKFNKYIASLELDSAAAKKYLPSMVADIDTFFFKYLYMLAESYRDDIAWARKSIAINNKKIKDKKRDLAELEAYLGEATYEDDTDENP